VWHYCHYPNPLTVGYGEEGWGWIIYGGVWRGKVWLFAIINNFMVGSGKLRGSKVGCVLGKVRFGRALLKL
jgi:hypothetical protein